LVVAALSGCATTDSDGCPSDECRSQMAVAKARWAQEDAARNQSAAAASACAQAEANPSSADPGYVRQCHLTRWRSSQIVCSDLRVAEQLIEVTCEIPIRGGQADLTTATEMLQRRAAVAALAAGRAHMMVAGDQPPVVHFASEPDRVMTCHNRLFVIPYSVDCESTSLQPSALSVTLRRRYELLSESEAATRTSRDLPADRQPQSAREINQLYAGFP
jgi:hypothetical protein